MRLLHLLLVLAATLLFGQIFTPLALAAAPKVVEASPDDGQSDVDPKMREIRIVFDQPMNTGGGWSVVGGGETFPNLLGKPRWVNDRTFTWQWKLEPGREYWLSINSPTFTNFRGKNGESAEPYPISFKTAGGAAPAAILTADENRRAIQILRDAIDKDYSYRDLHQVDWVALFEKHASALESAKSPEDFARVAARMLAENRDVHVWLKVAEKTIPSHRPRYVSNVRVPMLQRLVPQWTSHNDTVFTGRFEDGIGYVLITGWSREAAEALKAAYALLPQADKGLIVDVRPNGGGDELLARGFAGCFIDAPKVYSRNTIRQNGQEEGPFDRIVEPNKARPAYRGRVVVLMGPGNMSSCESFLLMMRQNPNCVLVGEKSYGSSGRPMPVDLGNGVTAFLPSWRDMLPDGTLLEGRGVEPDVAVTATSADWIKGDPVLEAGLKALRDPPGR